MHPRIVEAHGSRYAIGFKIGASCRDLIRRDMAVERPRRLSPQEQALFLRDSWDATEKAFPEIAEEIRGGAAGAGVPILGLFRTLTEESYDFEEREIRGCTDVVAVPPATVPGIPLVMGHNNDAQLPEGNPDKIVLVRSEPDGAPASLQFTFSGFGVAAGLNARGVALGGNHLTADDVRPGIPRLIISRAVLDAPDLLSAQWVCLEDSRASSYNNVLGDASGEVLSQEGSALDSGILRPGPDGLLWHTNHYLHSEMTGHESRAQKDMPNSLNRVYWAEQRLKAAQGRIDSEVVQDILRDHSGAPESICRHDSPMATAFSVVLEPAKRKAWFLLGRPCKGRYTPYTV